MGRRRSENPHRNTVAVRFKDDQLADVTKAAGLDGGENADVSPWVREAAVEKARRRLKKEKT